jgi:hypothetical protein
MTPDRGGAGTGLRPVGAARYVLLELVRREQALIAQPRNATVAVFRKELVEQLFGVTRGVSVECPLDDAFGVRKRNVSKPCVVVEANDDGPRALRRGVSGEQQNPCGAAT